MTFVKQGADGNWYIFRGTKGVIIGRKPKSKEGSMSNVYFIKAGGNGHSGNLRLDNVVLPERFLGKKVVFRVEVLE